MLLVQDAVFHGLSLIEKDDWKRHQSCAAENGILRWIMIRKDLMTWDKLMPGHVMEFCDWMRETKGVKETTINNYLNPLRLAAKWVRLYRPELDRNLFTRRMVKRGSGRKHARYLMVDQVETAIETGRRMGHPEVVAAMHFGALAGLRLKEIVSLTSDDFKAGTIATGAKTDYSERVIPLCDKPLQFAEGYFALFHRFPVKSYFTLSRNIAAVLRQCAKDTGDESFNMVDPHEALRTTFFNLALQAGCENDFIRAYCGHAPDNTMTKHYGDLIPSIKDMPRIKDAKLDMMRSRIVSVVNKKIA